ncbi:hypothetical protein F5878DRAFT_666894 [Lentinula raphanica]|uniref:Uncharacterized protein n=1 Tax=Lentinula raphanica TaxID=153919 RepID=A0AA38NWT2_9AGAR|nr:hypothetical protein F5878DRAFT_666894 [Lentinula raphanica]
MTLNRGYLCALPWAYDMPPQSMPPLMHRPSSQNDLGAAEFTFQNIPVPLPSGLPGTPILSLASMTSHSPPPAPRSYSSSNSVNTPSWPPPTPSTSSGNTVSWPPHQPSIAIKPRGTQLNTKAKTFVPCLHSKVTIKDSDGFECNLENLKQDLSPHPSPLILKSLSSPSPSPPGLMARVARVTHAIPIVAPSLKKRYGEEGREECQAAAALGKESKANEEAEKEIEEECSRKDTVNVVRETTVREEAVFEADEEAEHKAHEMERHSLMAEGERKELKTWIVEESLREEKLKLEAEKRRKDERRSAEEQMELVSRCEGVEDPDVSLDIGVKDGEFRQVIVMVI